MAAKAALTAMLTAACSGGQLPGIPLQSDRSLIDKMTRSRGVYAGGTPYVKWSGGLQARDSLGRHRHIIRITLSTRVRVVLASTHDEVSPYQLRGLVSQIHLSDIGGTPYLTAVDGRNVVDDDFARHFSLHAPLGHGIAKEMPAGTYDIPIDIDIALTDRGGDDGRDGAILLAALQALDGNQGMRWTFRSTIPGNPVGVTVGDSDKVAFTCNDGQEGCEIWARWVALNDPSVTAPAVLRAYSRTESRTTLLMPRSRTLYAMVRFPPEDGADNQGQILVQQLDEISVKVGGEDTGITRAIDYYQRQRELAIDSRLSAAARDRPDLDIPAELANVNDGGHIGPSYLFLVPPRARAVSVAGQVTVNIGQMGTADEMVILHRAVLPDDPSRAAAIIGATSCGCGAVNAAPQMETGTSTGTVDPTATKVIVTPNLTAAPAVLSSGEGPQ